ncbi:glycosyltransferase family 4 protein [Cellulophaga baltica]|uniref:glycosyltransferase family 4 protein n=1 Tax=Cellulophaga TaxID=104264 RepID=UPI001C072457|nr:MULTISPECIES: glycosyltransferase family 4 protein [Cellulophaga]MBU2996137.1 glycosyltransferase family 4 protein [Cellulophaga baltica]MDO6767532.1 glycosyltransferase family 4 protein [Cellulophaga sp. 1_MG-2023]
MKKVLIITYYWPPAGGPGVQRWLKFVKYLRDFGVEPIVYIPENPNYPIIDEAFLYEIPEVVKIYKQPIFEPYKLASIFSSKKTKQISSGIIQTKNQSTAEKIMLWIRGNVFIPDARKYWIKPSIKFLETIIEKEAVETIITTGPPHSVHLIGLGLKRKLTLNWLADFRDPWTTIGYHKKLKLTASSEKKHKNLERTVLNMADKIIVTSATTKREFNAITAKPIEVITNGFDTNIASTETFTLDTDFTISHIGSLLTGRNPKNLWRVLSELAHENNAFKNALKLNLIGVVSDDVLETIKNLGLEPFVELLGYVSHEKALVYQKKTQILLLAEIDSEETSGIIPGKLFEYMASKRPILALGPKNWEAGNIVVATQTGNFFNYSEESELKQVILNWFKLYQKNQLTVNSRGIQQYHRKELTQKLAKLL